MSFSKYSEEIKQAKTNKQILKEQQKIIRVNLHCHGC